MMSCILTVLFQSGFGWTNGVVLYFLELYPDLAVTESTNNSAETTDPGSSTETTLGDGTEATPGNSTALPPGDKQSLGWLAAPILVVVLAVLVVLACVVWCRWLYSAGERRYWGRVQNEHLQAAGGATADTSETRRRRDSSEETEDSVDNDKKELFSWNKV